MQWSNALELDNWILMFQVYAKMAYNFWPVVVFMFACLLWEHYVYEAPRRRRLKSRIANRSDTGRRYRDR